MNRKPVEGLIVTEGDKQIIIIQCLTNNGRGKPRDSWETGLWRASTRRPGYCQMNKQELAK